MTSRIIDSTGQRLELTGKRLDCIRRETVELLEKWDNRLKFPFDRLPERYIRGDLRVHLHVEYSRQGNLSNGNACLVYSHNAPQTRCFEVNAGRENDERQFPVFIGSVHVVDTPKQSISRLDTLVRLQVIDTCKSERSVGDALYFSAIESRFVWVSDGVVIKDGELDVPTNLLDAPTGFIGQLPSEMIETGTKMVDDLSREDGKTQGNRILPLGFQEFRSELLPRIALLIGEDWVYTGTYGEVEGGEVGEKRSNLQIQVVDTLIGPF